MNRTVLPIVALAGCVSLAACSSGVPPASTKLLCDGKYSHQDRPGAEMPIRGIYVGVSAARVKIDGSVGFDGTYLVSRVDDRLVVFVNEADPASSGFLNRLNGDLSLTHGRDPKTHWLTAECRTAKHLF